LEKHSPNDPKKNKPTHPDKENEYAEEFCEKHEQGFLRLFNIISADKKSSGDYSK